MAHQFHPDKQGGSEDKFKEVNEAYQVLSDPKKRSNYDNFGFAYNDGYQGGSGGQEYSDFSDFFSGFRGGPFDNTQGGQHGGADNIFDIFSEMMGGGYARPSYQEETRKGEDVYLEAGINKKDLGTTRVFEYSILDKCDECKGSGVEKGYKLVNCGTCGGAGQVKQTSRSAFGAFTRIGLCPNCHGKRKMPEKECRICSGAGRMKAKRKFEVQIPQELDSGYTIIVPKGGNSGKDSQPSGDLIIQLKVK